MTAFSHWVDRWTALASYTGTKLTDVNARVAAVARLWHEPIPEPWQRPTDRRLLQPQRYCRGNLDGRRCGEHVVEYEILVEAPPGATYLGGRLVDGVNAVPLARDPAGGRRGNVEADMLLLVEEEHFYRELLVEVKVNANNAWYAVVENLRQLRLYLGSREARSIFSLRLGGIEAWSTPVTGVVLAPPAFYESRGQKRESVSPARRLADAMFDQVGVRVELAVYERPGFSCLRSSIL